MFLEKEPGNEALSTKTDKYFIRRRKKNSFVFDLLTRNTSFSKFTEDTEFFQVGFFF